MIAMRTLTCRQCGMSWDRPCQRGNPPVRCPECAARPRVPRPRKAQPTVTRVVDPRRAHRLDTTSAGYKLASAVTAYRLAIEEATCALRLGRVRDALAALERVEAPQRRAEPGKRNAVIELPA